MRRGRAARRRRSTKVDRLCWLLRVGERGRVAVADHEASSERSGVEGVKGSGYIRRAISPAVASIRAPRACAGADRNRARAQARETRDMHTCYVRSSVWRAVAWLSRRACCCKLLNCQRLAHRPHPALRVTGSQVSVCRCSFHK